MVATGDIFIIVYVFLRDNKLKQMSIGTRPCRKGAYLKSLWTSS